MNVLEKKKAALEADIEYYSNKLQAAKDKLELVNELIVEVAADEALKEAEENVQVADSIL